MADSFSVLPERSPDDDDCPSTGAAIGEANAALLERIDCMLLRHHARIAKDFEQIASRLRADHRRACPCGGSALEVTLEPALSLSARPSSCMSVRRVKSRGSHWAPSYARRSSTSGFDDKALQVYPPTDGAAQHHLSCHSSKEAIARTTTSHQHLMRQSLDIREEAEEKSRMCQLKHEESLRHSISKQAKPTVCGRFKASAKRLTNNFSFDLVIAFVITCNSVLIGFEIEHNAAHPLEPIPLPYRLTQHVFAVIFFVELLIRISAEGVWSYFFGWNDWAWHYLDVVLVGSALLELLMDIIGGIVGAFGGIVSMRVLRIMRITRLIRVIRVARLAELLRAFRTLVMEIMGTMKSLGWAVLLLLIIIYMFGILFTRATIDFIADLGPDPTDAEVLAKIDRLRRFWGSLWVSMFSLMQSITGGISWEEVVRPLFTIGNFYVWLFTGFILFCYLAVLNVITGVFCESAIASAMTDKEMAVHAVLADREDYSARILEFFQAVDTDNSGTITLREFETALDSGTFRAHLESMQISPNDVWSFFQLLDDNRDNEIDVAEFVTGCMRMRGNAKAVDLAKVAYDNSRILKRLEALQQSRFVMRMAEEQYPSRLSPEEYISESETDAFFVGGHSQDECI